MERRINMTTACAQTFLSLAPHHLHEVRNLGRRYIRTAQSIDNTGLVLREQPVACGNRWRRRCWDRCVRASSSRLSHRICKCFSGVCLRYV